MFFGGTKGGGLVSTLISRRRMDVVVVVCTRVRDVCCSCDCDVLFDVDVCDDELFEIDRVMS
jgi:hypothetical protein